MKNRLPTLITLFAIVAIVVVAGLMINRNNSPANSNDAGTQVQTNNTATAEIAIKDFAFAASTVTVKAGTKVTWTNNDSTAHTATSIGNAPESFDSGLLDQGKSFSMTFTKTGTYEYKCTPHPDMRGTIVVTN